MKTILITGGTGFIGQELRELLLQEGHTVIVVTRSPEKYKDEAASNQQFISWDENLIDVVNRTDAIINLAGENIFGQRWTEEVKQRIYDSRIESTRQLVEAMRKAPNKPRVFVSASASGIYGNRGSEMLTEKAPHGNDFLAKLCHDWETEARKAAEFGVRVTNPRIGIVLEKGGGALKKMIPPFRLFVGGPIGEGSQYMSWVHREDLINMLIFPLKNEEIVGPYNACTPAPVTMQKFAETLGRVMHRPSFFRVPEMALKVVLGEGAGPILDSIRMKPEVLLNANFEFLYDDLEEALVEILNS